MVRPIWREIESYICYKIEKRIVLNENEIMIGILERKGVSKTDVVWINHMILVGKMVISKVKYGPKRPTLAVLKNDLTIRHLIKSSD